MADEQQASITLDPTVTLRELMELNEVKARAAAGAARMVEDYLKNRVLVLATQGHGLMTANLDIAGKLGEMEAQMDGLRAEVAVLQAEQDGSAE